MELRYCEKCGDILKLEVGNDKINPTERFVCSRCDSGGIAPQRAEGGDEIVQNVLADSSLNLFSPATVAVRKVQMEKETLQHAELKLADPPVEGGATPHPSSGSSQPARTARKLQFRCLHCRVMLMIRPVEKPSRIICPKCKGNLFIDQTGIVSKTPPSYVVKKQKTQKRAASGSSAARKNEAPPAAPAAPAPTGAGSPPGSSRVVLDKTGSVRIVKSKPGSAVLRAPEAPPSPALRGPVEDVPSPLDRLAQEPSAPRAPGSEDISGEAPAPLDFQQEGDAPPPPDPFQDALSGGSAGLEFQELPGGEVGKDGSFQEEPAPGGLLEGIETDLDEAEDLAGSPKKSGDSRTAIPSSRHRRSVSDYSPGARRLAGAVLLSAVLAALLSGPFFLVGSPAALGSGKPRFSGEELLDAHLERLGNTIQQGKVRFLELPSRWISLK